MLKAFLPQRNTITATPPVWKDCQAHRLSFKYIRQGSISQHNSFILVLRQRNLFHPPWGRTMHASHEKISKRKKSIWKMDVHYFTLRCTTALLQLHWKPMMCIRGTLHLAAALPWVATKYNAMSLVESSRVGGGLWWGAQIWMVGGIWEEKKNGSPGNQNGSRSVCSSQWTFCTRYVCCFPFSLEECFV